jgi:RNA polymerase sigma factor (sigma-70 family)
MEQLHGKARTSRYGPLSEHPDPAHGEAVAAFLELFAPHVPAVMRVATALVGAADAEDAAQEALVRAWQADRDPKDIAAPRAWLLRITVNLCTDWCRGRFGTRRRVTGSLDAVAGTDALATLAFDPGTSDHTGALDVRRAINGLERDLRVVVALRYYAGLDSAEIGSLLGIPAATVRSRLRRALSVLRERLVAPQPLPNAADPKGGR